MKNGIKILGTALLTAIYFFAVVTTTYLSVRSHSNHVQASGQDQYLTSVSKSFFCHTAQSESAVGSFNDFPSPNFKDFFDPIGLRSKGIERVLAVQFRQYRSFSLNFPIRYRKSDLIFPFHYYW